jgi:hypothetical protein
MLHTRLFAVGLLCCSVYGTAAAQGQGEFNASLLTYTMTVRNPSEVPRLLFKVGVESVAHGDFRCRSGSAILSPIADYRVQFDIRHAETEIPADPPIQVGPGAFARFTISLFPSAIGACGPSWSAIVTPFVVFDDGTRLVARPTEITGDDVEAFKNRKLTDAELSIALKDPYSDVRQFALLRLQSSGFSQEARERFLATALKDKDREVASTAARVVGDLGYKGLLPDLISGASCIDYAFVRAIGRFTEPRAIDYLLECISSGQGICCSTSALAAIEPELVHGRISRMAAQAWSKYKTLPGAGESELLDVLALLSWFGRMDDVPLLSDVLTSESSRQNKAIVLRSVVRYLTNSVDNERDFGGMYVSPPVRLSRGREPFFVALAPIVAVLETDRNSGVENAAKEFKRATNKP